MARSSSPETRRSSRPTRAADAGPVPAAGGTFSEPLPEDEYRRIYRRVPRLTVELVIRSREGVVLVQRQRGPCRGLWVLPGGTVRFGESLDAAVRRIGRDELARIVRAGPMLGVLEYPSHLDRVGDWPIGIAYESSVVGPLPTYHEVAPEPVGVFAELPRAMHEEQRVFLKRIGVRRSAITLQDTAPSADT